MGSKRTKKTKQELELFPEKIIAKKTREKEDDLPLEINNSDIENMNNVMVPAVAPKAPKRKKKSEGGEVAPKRRKKANGDPAKAKPPRKRKPKISVLATENGGIVPPPVNGEMKPMNNKILADKGKEKKSFAWPTEDITLLLDRIESHIPAQDILAYRSRLEKMNWDNVAFKNYTGEECKKTWFLVQRRIRRFRLLGEILNDARAWISTPVPVPKPVKPVKPAKPAIKPIKPKRHPDMPRRPLSSYLMFYLKKKDEIIKQNPGFEGVSASDLTKLIGQTYKNLSPEVRQEYEQMAANNREEYAQSMKIFYDTHPECIPPPKSRVRKPKPKPEDKLPKVDKPQAVENNNKTLAIPPPPPPPPAAAAPRPEKPKRPGRPPRLSADGRPSPPKREPPKERIKLPMKNQTPFSCYYAFESKSKDPAIEKHVFREKCKLAYKEMPDDQKLYWIHKAEQDLVRYTDELKAFKINHPQVKIVSATAAARPVLTRKERLAKERAAGKPIKPPNSAYAQYSRYMLQSAEVKLINPKTRMNYIADKWKNCSPEEQNIYKEQVVQLMEQYRQEWQTYLNTLSEEERKKLLDQEKKAKRKPVRKKAPSGWPTRKSKPRSRPNRNPRRPSKAAPAKLKFTEPEQPPISACKYFATLYKGDADPVQAWKNLSSDEKRKFEEDLVKKKQAYIVEFEKFLKSLSKEELEAFSKSRQQQVKSDEESSDCSSESDGEAGGDDEEDADEDGHNNDSDSG